MSRIDAVLQRITEDTGWREDLTDSEAESLIAWAKNRLARLHTQAVDEADFEQGVAKLRALLPKINRFVGARASMSPEEQQALLDTLADATGLAHASPAQITTAAGAAKAAAESAAQTGDSGVKSPTDQFRALAAQVDPSLKESAPETLPANVGDQLPVLNALTAWIDGAALPTADAALSALVNPPASLFKAQAAEPPPPPDPSAASILDFFNTAPPEETPTSDDPTSENP